MKQTNTLLALDIETIQDPNVLGDWDAGKWPPPIGWQVVVIGMVEANIDVDHGSEAFNITQVRSGAGDEAALLQTFWSYFEQKPPRVVTWNGRRFDLSVLQHRSFMHGVPMPAWFRSGSKWSSYKQRFADDWHCDLMDVMSSYGASTPASLDMMASSLGLPGKIGGHGSEVQDMFDAGDIDRIRAYCEGDVLNLYGLYVRWRYVTGEMSREAHDAAFGNLADTLGAGSSEKPHFGDFLKSWHPTSLDIGSNNASKAGTLVMETANE